MLDEYNLRYIADGEIIELTQIEASILSIILQCKNRIATYEVLCKYVYGKEMRHNAINKTVFGLREKLKGILEIKTKRGKGYYT